MSKEEQILISKEFFLDRYRELLLEAEAEEADDYLPNNPDLTSW